MTALLLLLSLACQDRDPFTGIKTDSPAIVMVANIDACHLSAMWWEMIRPMMQKDGWQVRMRREGAVPVSQPVFRIYSHGRWHTHRGWLLRSHVTKLIGRPTI